MGVKPLTIDEYLEIEAIKKIRVLYSQYFDSHQVDRLAELFADDAVCEFGDPLPYGDWHGRDEIRENYAKVASGAAKPFAFMHAATNHHVELTGPDSATGSSFLLDLNLGDTEQPLTLVGVYNDVYKKVGGEWFIAKTRIEHIWMASRASG